jgi:hypothetical protein
MRFGGRQYKQLLGRCVSSRFCFLSAKRRKAQPELWAKMRDAKSAKVHACSTAREAIGQNPQRLGPSELRLDVLVHATEQLLDDDIFE